MKRKLILLLFLVVAILILAYTSYDTEVVKIGIIDTELSSEIVSRYNISEIIGNNANDSNSNTHGDMVVNIIKSQCKNCEIYYYAISSQLTFDVVEVVSAIEWLMDKNVDVINMSFAGLTDHVELREKVNLAIANDIVVVASALNFSQLITYPANYEGVISVSNCVNPNAVICLTDKNIKNTVGDGSTSALTAYVSGIVARNISRKNFSIKDIVLKYNKN